MNQASAASFKGNKQSLPSKTCAACGRPMAWRKRWARSWNEVKVCSEACRKARGAAGRSRAADNRGSLAAELLAAIEALKPQRLLMTAPGDWRVWQSLKAVAGAAGLPLEVCEDRHFYTTVREFAHPARGRKALRLAYFYREVRQRHGVLMNDGQPEGGR